MEHWVSFPSLGLTFDLSPILAQFSLFGKDITIHWYGVMIAVGFFLAVVYAYVRAPQVGVDRDRMMDVVLVSTVVAVLCARLYYVIFHNASYYFSNPEKIFAIWDGGLAIYGGIIGAFVCGFVLCRVRKVSVLSLFDLAAIGFLIGQGLGRWGNFFNQEAYGGNTDLPWGMTGDMIQSGEHGVVTDQTAPVHPTFLYESLWCLLGALVLHLMFKRCYRFKGQIFASYLMWYGLGRAFIEGLRSDSLYLGIVRVSQLVAIASVLGGALLLFLFSRHERTKQEQAQLQEIFDDMAPVTEDINTEEEINNG